MEDELAALPDAALAELGYPPCPGNIMLINPLWRQPLAAFKDKPLKERFALCPWGLYGIEVARG